ncbi:PAS domain S-box protein [Fibrella aquatilis]|uniref:Sensory/regulatory protein RpfC n=1 Tax=Fibrella aquatilis TaxID=2817059 RepID=A0A939G136_9BACT|nr:PAS domain S-box protein [Fibrella aquatilis]MBO0930034.1 PAS domain S-box protein [Fibrella aquatilis]
MTTTQPFDVRHTVDQLNLIGLTVEHDGSVSYVNPYTLRVTAWSIDDVIGRNFFDVLVPPDDRPTLETLFREALQRGGFPESREVQLLTRSGSTRNVHINSFIPTGAGGRPDAFTIIGEDLTNKRRVASALSNTNAQLQDLVDNTSDLIQLITLDGKFIFVNKAWRDLLGYSADQIAQLTLRDVLHPDYVKSTIDRLQRVQEGEPNPSFETVFRSRDGRTVFLSGSVNCRYDQGKPTAFRCILRDITQKIRSEKAQRLYYSIASWTLNTPNLDDFYQRVHRELGNIIDASNFFIALYDQSKRYLTFPYYVDESFQGSVRFTKKRLGSGLTEYTINANKPLFLYDTDILRLADEHQIDLYGQQQPKVMLTAPLRIGDEITGIIGVKSYDDASLYGPRDLELLEFISGQVALAIARKQAEAALNKQTARLNAIFDSSTYLIWSANKAMQLTSFNKNYARLIEQLTGEQPRLYLLTHQQNWITVGEENRKMLDERYRLAFKGQPQNFEMRFDLSGKETWLELHLNPILLTGGVIEEVSGIARDITTRKGAQMNIERSEEKFRGIFENLQDIYVRVDRQSRITMISPSVFKRSGYMPDEVLGQNALQYFVDPSVVRRALFKLVRTRSLRNFEATLRRKDGTERQFMFNMLLLKDEDGRYSVIAALARDITELKRQSAELVKAKDEAERSLKVKERFLANMSHEIRTPMNGVIGMVDLLNDTVLNDEQRDYVRTIRRSSETLLNILNDILDLSKIEAGKMVLHEAPVALGEVFEKLIALFGQQANAKDNRLFYTLAPDLPQFVIADQTRLLQILSNLTSNALKFTENGTVEVAASLVSKRGKFNRIKVEVKDSGIGISPENIGLLFNSFSQVDTSSRKSFGGTGLGLSISKELASLMKGEVGVESTVGMGSTFWFTVEVKETAISPTQSPAEAAADMKVTDFFTHYNPIVLLVDDNIVNRKVASEILRKAGCVVTNAASGPEAIEKVTASYAPGGTPFDVIFMDIQMPDMDGVETTKHLRDQHGKALPKIVAMTAYSMREDRERFLSQGLDDYIAKPIRAQGLIAKVSELVKKSGEQRADSREQRGESREGRAAGSGQGGESRAQRAENWSSNAQPLNSMPAAPSPTLLAPYADVPVIDLDILEQLRDIGGAELVESVFDDFVTEATELVQESLTAFAAGDIATVKSHLHTLKGSAGTVGVARLARIAREAEGKLKVQDTSQLAQELAALKAAFDEFMATPRP